MSKHCWTERLPRIQASGLSHNMGRKTGSALVSAHNKSNTSQSRATAGLTQGLKQHRRSKHLLVSNPVLCCFQWNNAKTARLWSKRLHMIKVLLGEGGGGTKGRNEILVWQQIEPFGIHDGINMRTYLV